MVDDRAELSTISKKTCSICVTPLVQKPSERLNNFYRRTTCGATKCLREAKQRGFNDHVDWYREETGFPAWVNFGQYDISDTEQGIFSPESRSSAFVRTRSSIAEF